MSNALATVDLQTNFSEVDVSSLGVWSGSDDESRLKVIWNAGRILASAGILGFVVSTATAVSDNWFLEKQKRVAITAPGVSERVIGRSISRSEALRISRQIIERAEWERIQLGEWEAERGLQWEEGE